MCYGIMANKWRLLLKAIDTNETAAECIVKCICVLHNVVINKEGIDDVLRSAVKQSVDKRELQTTSVKTGRKYNCSTSNALTVRNYWKMYFDSLVAKPLHKNVGKILLLVVSHFYQKRTYRILSFSLVDLQ
jgi:hypothetical protein